MPGPPLTRADRTWPASITNGSTRFISVFAVLPDGPERDQLFFEGKRLFSVYVPYKHHVHRILTDLTWPWVIGFRRPPYWRDWWTYVDIDAEQQAKAISA